MLGVPSPHIQCADIEVASGATLWALRVWHRRLQLADQVSEFQSGNTNDHPAAARKSTTSKTSARRLGVHRLVIKVI